MTYFPDKDGPQRLTSKKTKTKQNKELPPEMLSATPNREDNLVSAIFF